MHRRILTDLLRIGVLTTLAKAAGAAKTVVIARFFGTAGELDAFLMAFLIPSFAADVLAGSITQALLPVFIDVRDNRGDKEAGRLYTSVLIGTVALLSVAAVLVALSSGLVLRFIATGFNPSKIALTRSLLFLMLPILPLSALNVTWRTLLNAEERFAVAAVAPVVTPVVTIALLVAASHWGIHALAAGTLAGTFFEVVVLGCALGRTRVALTVPWDFSGEGRRVLAQYLPVVSSSLVMLGSPVVNQTMAAMLGPGSVSALSYGTRLATVILAIGPGALGTAILPRLARLAASREWIRFGHTLRLYAVAGFALTIPLTGGLVLGSPLLVRLFFERGAFTPSDTDLVAGVQRLSLLQIPFSVVLTLLLKAISSMEANRLLLGLAVLSLAANVVFNLLLMRSHGAGGIALSTTAVHALGLVYLASMASRTLGRKRPAAC